MFKGFVVFNKQCLKNINSKDNCTVLRVVFPLLNDELL